MRKLQRLLTVLSLVISPAVLADVANINGKIIRTMHTGDDNFGSCMAHLERPIADAGVDCRSYWVSFSCTGDFTTKDNAYRMYDMAQMAQALQRQAVLTVNDAKKHNGYCVAEAIVVR